MKLRHRTTLDRVVRLAVAFDAAEDDTIDLVVPDDLTGVSDAELAALREQVQQAFDEVYQGGNPVDDAGNARAYSDADMAALRDLRAASDRIVGEETGRAENAATNAADAAALAAGMGGGEGEGEEGEGDAAEGEGEGEGDAAPATTPPAQGAPQGNAQPIAAGGQPLTFRRAGRRRAQPPVRREDSSLIRASANAFGQVAGAALTMDDLADLYRRAEGSVSKGSIQAAIRAGQAYQQRTALATIRVPHDERAIVRSEDPAEVMAAVAWASGEARLPGGSLVAAGGWCSPSETLYDLCQLESTEGLISLPTLNPSRGGLKNTLGPDWATAFIDTGFCFTEAQDVDGDYVIDNEEQSVTEGGSGLTSFTLTYSGQTTGAIPASTTSAAITAALEALSNIGAGDVTVTGPAGSSTGPWTVTFLGAFEDENVAQMTATPTGGTGTVTIATVSAGDVTAPGKPCSTVPCDTWVDNRLGVCGVCINAGILMSRSFPEMVRRWTSGVLTLHMHRIAGNVIQRIIAGSTPVTVADGLSGSPGVLAPLMSALELQAEAVKDGYKMRRGTTLEVTLPFWIRGAIRADLSRRLGVDLTSISDAQINSKFTERGINPQFVYNFDDLALNPTTWPTSVRALMYPAGTWVRLQGDIITLEALHDSTLNAQNNYTALFTEEAWEVMKTCHVSRVITVPICPSGATQGGVDLVCDPTP